MKLIDLLVQELPKRGGWPEDAFMISMHDDGCIYINGMIAPEGFHLPQCSDGWIVGTDIDNATTKDEYEYALAASQQPAWSGEGLPPAGCECEVIPHNNRWGFLDTSAHAGKVIAYDGEDFWFKPENGGNVVSRTDKVNFRPIRTEAERKREEEIKFMSSVFRDHVDNKKSNGQDSVFHAIYDAFKAGKFE